MRFETDQTVYLPLIVNGITIAEEIEVTCTCGFEDGDITIYSVEAENAAGTGRLKWTWPVASATAVPTSFSDFVGRAFFDQAYKDEDLQLSVAEEWAFAQ